MDLWTGPLARASRLSAKRAHLWMAGWTTLRVAHAPTHRPSAAHKLHRALPPRIELSKTKNTKNTKPFNSRRHHAPIYVNYGGSPPDQIDLIHTIKPAQPSNRPKSVTMPKSPVTFTEIRTRRSDPHRDHPRAAHNDGDCRTPGAIGVESLQSFSAARRQSGN